MQLQHSFQIDNIINPISNQPVILLICNNQMKKQTKSSNSKVKIPESSIDHTSIQSPKGLKKQNKFLESTDNLSQKQKLVEQNVRLKTQIFQLTKQLQNIMSEENKKKNTMKSSREDEAIRAKQMELKKEQLEVLNLKNKINVVKTQLEAVFSNRTLLNKEDQMKKLKNQLESLEEQKNSLIKLRDNQAQGRKIIKTEEMLQERISELKQQLHSLKQEAKSLNQKHIQAERTLRKSHQNYILKQNKLKQLSQKIGSVKANPRSSKVKESPQITQNMLKQLKQEVANLQQQRKNNEKSWEQKISRIQSQMSEKKLQEQRKLTILKYKQRQLRLMELKLKQVGKDRSKKSMSHSFQAPPIDVDMHQFRHKRNIKYMEQ